MREALYRALTNQQFNLSMPARDNHDISVRVYRSGGWAAVGPGGEPGKGKKKNSQTTALKPAFTCPEFCGSSLPMMTCFVRGRLLVWGRRWIMWGGGGGAGRQDQFAKTCPQSTPSFHGRLRRKNQIAFVSASGPRLGVLAS